MTFVPTIEGAATSYQWEFGGGSLPNVSTAEAPESTLLKPGQFHGTVRACNGEACSEGFSFSYAVQTPVAPSGWGSSFSLAARLFALGTVDGHPAILTSFVINGAGPPPYPAASLSIGLDDPSGSGELHWQTTEVPRSTDIAGWEYQVVTAGFVDTPTGPVICYVIDPDNDVPKQIGFSSAKVQFPSSPTDWITAAGELPVPSEPSHVNDIVVLQASNGGLGLTYRLTFQMHSNDFDKGWDHRWFACNPDFTGTRFSDWRFQALETPPYDPSISPYQRGGSLIALENSWAIAFGTGRELRWDQSHSFFPADAADWDRTLVDSSPTSGCGGLARNGDRTYLLRSGIGPTRLYSSEAPRPTTKDWRQTTLDEHYSFFGGEGSLRVVGGRLYFGYWIGDGVWHMRRAVSVMPETANDWQESTLVGPGQDSYSTPFEVLGVGNQLMRLHLTCTFQAGTGCGDFGGLNFESANSPW